ncbi:MAG: Fe-S cluster assembly protein SufD [Actinobacteria bacterium]|nr:Fe-S cluster assembly protein SufD [Actinomycetota bacterium]
MAEVATRSTFTSEALPAPEGEPAFVRSLRERALEEFEALPMPSPETEEWRYTDVTDLDLAFEPFADGGGPEAVKRHGLLAAAGVVGERAGLQIQRNSEVISRQASEDLDSRGVVFTSLERAAAEHPDLVEPHLHALVPTDRSRFTALHGAFWTGGTFLHVPAGVAVELPIQTLTYLDADGAAVFPRTLIVAEESAQVTFIDRYVSPALSRALSAGVVEIVAGPASRVSYVNLQEWGDGVQHLAVQRAVVGADAKVRSLGVAFGATLARTEVESVLEGDGGSSELLGLYFGDADQHIDHRSIQDHVGSRTSSDLLYKGALQGSSRAINTGTVIIRQGAHRCDAYQTNRNVLLSETAKAHSVPNLEILTNDPVRCGHAASVGPVDEDELFYLQTRGIPADEAERLIVTGFFREVLDRVALEEIRRGLEQAIEQELDRGRREGP